MIVEPRTAYLSRSIARIEVDQAEREQAPAFIKAIFGTGRVSPEHLEAVKTAGGPRGEVWIEGEIVDPDSGRWRTCYVRIRAEQVLPVLKLCREAAREQREKPMEVSGE